MKLIIVTCPHCNAAKQVIESLWRHIPFDTCRHCGRRSPRGKWQISTPQPKDLTAKSKNDNI